MANNTEMEKNNNIRCVAVYGQYLMSGQKQHGFCGLRPTAPKNGGKITSMGLVVYFCMSKGSARKIVS